MQRLPDLEEEALLWKQGSAFVFGVDEAGRGCLAGPVCAAVSCWAPLGPGEALPVPVRDSKLMREKDRERAFAPIQERALAFGVGFASAAEIDRWNILRANYLAVGRALECALAMLPGPMDPSQCSFLTDGSHPLVSRAGFFAGMAEYESEFPRLKALFAGRIAEKPVVKGDGKVFSIAAASVLAKVSRDRRMKELCAELPGYDFSVHKGYGTAKHLESLRRLGPSPEHRRTFAPVTEVLGDTK